MHFLSRYHDLLLTGSALSKAEYDSVFWFSSQNMAGYCSGAKAGQCHLVSLSGRLIGAPSRSEAQGGVSGVTQLEPLLGD